MPTMFRHPASLQMETSRILYPLEVPWIRPLVSAMKSRRLSCLARDRGPSSPMASWHHHRDQVRRSHLSHPKRSHPYSPVAPLTLPTLLRHPSMPPQVRLQLPQIRSKHTSRKSLLQVSEYFQLPQLLLFQRPVSLSLRTKKRMLPRRRLLLQHLLQRPLNLNYLDSPS